ncbi:MAG: acriflavin resistance protein, partial [Chloroflexota bacterium]|nr:acriflavin resistance protein [Chloroflexota bacterium]
MSDTAGTPAMGGVPAAGPGAGPASSGAGSPRRRRISPYVGLLPFFLYVSIFLLLPTLIVAVGAFQDATGALTLTNIEAVFSGPAYGDAFVRSIQLSIMTALAGAILGALLAWAVASGNPGGWLRQTVIAASGVLA